MSVIANNLPFLLGGLGITLLLSLATVTGSLMFGSALAIAGQSAIRLLRWAVKIYVLFMRCIPVLVWMIYVYFLLATLGVNLNIFWAVALSLVAYRSCYIAEVLRAALNSVSPGQRAAGIACALSKGQVLRHIIAPQALRNMRPALISECIKAVKDSTLASIIGLGEFLHRTDLVNLSSLVYPFELFAFAAIVYFVLLYALSLLSARVGGKRYEVY